MIRNIATLLLATTMLSGCNWGGLASPKHYPNYRTNHYQRTTIEHPQNTPEPSQHSQMLDAIRRSGLRRRPVLNRSEDKIYWALWRLLKEAGLSQDLKVLPQVNLGSAMADNHQGTDNTAYNSIRCKRADFCLTDKNWLPVAFVEFQGKGHHGRGFSANMDTLERDATKQAACAKAGVLYYAIPSRALEGVAENLKTGFLPLLLDFLQHPDTGIQEKPVARSAIHYPDDNHGGRAANAAPSTRGTLREF